MFQMEFEIPCPRPRSASLYSADTVQQPEGGFSGFFHQVTPDSTEEKGQMDELTLQSPFLSCGSLEFSVHPSQTHKGVRACMIRGFPQAKPEGQCDGAQEAHVCTLKAPGRPCAKALKLALVGAGHHGWEGQTARG